MAFSIDAYFSLVDPVDIKIAERKRSALCIPRIKFDGEVLYLELDCHRNNESFGAVRLQKV